jgi:hypothetical protein
MLYVRTIQVVLKIQIITQKFSIKNKINKNMKNKVLMAVILGLGLTNLSLAQTNPATFIKGTLDIKFGTRNKTASADKYTLNINVCDSAVFRGTVDAKPFVPGTFVNDNGSLTYSVDCDVVNPKNPSQTRNVGRLFGNVPVDQNNVYRFSDGNLKISVLGVGTARGFDSKFNGLALGKPPANKSMFAKIKQDALNFKKSIKGQTVAVVVSKYDKMEFQNHIVGTGPVQLYPEVTLNGAMIYDYARSVWYLKDITATYNLDGRQLIDRLSGNIRWFADKTGGEYQFDIRLNEPPPSEGAVFAVAQDESAFFETDNSLSALVGTMKYKDSMSGDSVIASMVQIDLTGNKLNKQQAMYLCKFLMLSSIVPLNAE